MTKYIAIALFFAVSLGTTNLQAQIKDPVEHCSGFSIYAETIMTLRQRGERLDDVMAFFQEYEKENGKQPKIYETIVLRAYEENLYNTPQFKKKTINEFANEVFMDCLKELRQSTQS